MPVGDNVLGLTFDSSLCRLSEGRCILALKFCYIMDKSLCSRERLLLRE